MNEIILLTGGAGFIGSHIAETYIENGAEVIVLDDLSSGKLTNLTQIIDHPNLYFYQGSILDKKLLAEIFTRYNITIVNNHAAQKSVPTSIDDPLYDNELNVIGVLNLLEQIKTHPIKRFLQASTGGALAKEITGAELSSEDDVPQFNSPYALTKFATEHYLKIYSKIYNFEYIALRYANVYGPRQIADGECGVVPIFVDNILAGRKSKLMTYADMPRGCTRDYIFVEDVAEFNQIAITLPTINSGVYNIGSGKEIAILDIYEELANVFASDLTIEYMSERVGDIKRSVIDSSKLAQNFDWLPHIDLTTGLQKLKNTLTK